MSRRIVDHERRHAMRVAVELARLVWTTADGSVVTQRMREQAAVFRDRLFVVDKLVQSEAVRKRAATKRRKAARRG